MTRRSVLSPWAKLLAIAIAALSVAVAQAQTPQAETDTDPPVRVGRMSYVSGDVSYSPAGNEEWVEAQLNRPVVTGDRLWADNGARAEMAVDDSAWWLGEQTSVTVSNLDDRIAQLQLQQGTLDFRVRRLPAGNIVEVDTPNLAFTATQPGRYRIQVDPQSGTTSVIVRSGGGEVYGESASYVVGNGEGYRFGGTDLANSEAIGAPPADAFDQFVDERDGRYDRSASVKYVSPEVVGYEDLDTYGAWSAQPSFGNVWFPRTVSAGWAPYRDGHWAWIDPWGWTWVDDAPWGFAPFHYGRWSHFDRGWGWVPGPARRPRGLRAGAGRVRRRRRLQHFRVVGARDRLVPARAAGSLSPALQREPQLLSAGERQQYRDQQHDEHHEYLQQSRQRNAGELHQQARSECRDGGGARRVRAVAKRRPRRRSATGCGVAARASADRSPAWRRRAPRSSVPLRPRASNRPPRRCSAQSSPRRRCRRHLCRMRASCRRLKRTPASH